MILEINETEVSILRSAMYWYSLSRHGYAGAIAQKCYRTREGNTPSLKTVNGALDAAKEVDTLSRKLRELT